MTTTIESVLEKAPPSDLERNWPWLRARIPSSDSNAAIFPRYHHLAFSVAEESLRQDNQGERPFLISKYNQVGDQEGVCRSPWTNHLFSLHQPPKDGSSSETLPVTNEELRRLEITFNEVWDAYKNLYYGHESVGSVYLSGDNATENSGAFTGWFGIHKNRTDLGASSLWKSASMVRVDITNDTEVKYTVDTSVCVVLSPAVENGNESTTAEVSATLSKSSTKTCLLQPEKVPLHVSHVEHIGTLMEANEIDLRSNLERVMMPKNPEILATLQKKQTQMPRPQVNPLMGMVMNSDLLKRRLAKTESSES